MPRFAVERPDAIVPDISGPHAHVVQLCLSMPGRQAADPADTPPRQKAIARRNDLSQPGPGCLPAIDASPNVIDCGDVARRDREQIGDLQVVAAEQFSGDSEVADRPCATDQR
jgi:hypothetical protein